MSSKFHQNTKYNIYLFIIYLFIHVFFKKQGGLIQLKNALQESPVYNHKKQYKYGNKCSNNDKSNNKNKKERLKKNKKLRRRRRNIM